MKERKRIHLIGVGGVGMAGLAVLLKADGHDVSGCDIHDSPRTRWLRGLGISVETGHDASHVRDADFAIVTPAVHPDNPEFRAARCVRYRGEVLAGLVSSRESIAVAGSHGKTTTSTFIARLLMALGERVSWAIGGETGDFPVAGANGGVLVVEADESDGTLALYHPTTLVVTNCEYDHPDHFKTPADYFACFDAARRQSREVVESGDVWERSDSDCALASVKSSPAIAALPVHNMRNALTAAAVALGRGHAADRVCAALAGIVGELPDRRFQLLAPGVYTDYAHHPTEMACAVAMARAVCRGRLRVLFQPHRHSRTRALLSDFPRAFAGADEVILCPTYAAFEPPVEGGDIADLYAACREAGVKGVRLARSCVEAWHHAKLVAGADDVALLLGAGDIIDLAPLVVSDEPVPHRRIIVGMGSNTWRSDLATGEEYVASDSPAGRPGSALGIPWMAGIPGTIGGWVKMNAGAFGHSISEVVRRVKVDGSWRDAKDCAFGYRTSSIDGEIQDVEWDEAALVSARADGTDYLSRRRRFPSGTKGSVFRNPPGDFAGRLLEEAGCKGLRVGGAYVWDGHANVIVSGPDATAGDFLALARIMRERVAFRCGVVLEAEVCGLGMEADAEALGAAVSGIAK